MSTVICGGIARPGFTRVWKVPRHSAALHLHRADLGDLVVVAIAARGLEVDHAEHDVVQGCAEVVEAALLGQLGDRTR